MSIVQVYEYRPMVGDPDDHRPDSRWALVFDPPRDDGVHVHDITCLFERIAPGDAIPLHTHEVDEVVMVEDGAGRYRLDGEEISISAGGVALIPAGTPHGLRNDGEHILSLKAIFPSRMLDITYLERNPAPGTEVDDARPAFRFDPRVDPV